MAHLGVLQSLELGGDLWQQLLATWIELERKLHFVPDGGRKLLTKNQPPAVSSWFKNAHNVRFQPTIGPIKAYSLSWWKWWTFCQPKWCTSTGDEPTPVIADDMGKDWDFLLVGSNNGIMCLVFSLFWWGSALKKDQVE
ncbi:hypothetical protein BS47DRAFT_1309004 [Hydnum rufescens UP504]|uniref:Uncharacterized protein n=1 Tax=Hydnum rufescens UP504 TaxID=1448309 RepID=A0A9P6DMW0_9AGAM|nr:hypothetical protein BS47DRAFT_1309004 [Hydnum rufescens UP504]